MLLTAVARDTIQLRQGSLQNTKLSVANIAGVIGSEIKDAGGADEDGDSSSCNRRNPNKDGSGNDARDKSTTFILTTEGDS